MRMRRKPWARPELAACEFFIDNASENIGKWKESFKKVQPLHIELGCGKGSFIGQIALKNPDINYLGVDIKSEVLAVGRRTIVKMFQEENREVDNILLTAHNIERIDLMMSPKDEAERIYINFCNPWPRGKHNKRRLTYTRQLEHYKGFLKKGGEIHFKTDDDGLFNDSVEYFKECGFEIKYLTRDLHGSDVKDNILTEHEIMFSQQGIPIKFLIAEYK